MIGEIIEKHDIKGGRYFDAPDSALHLWGEQGWRKSVGKSVCSCCVSILSLCATSRTISWVELVFASFGANSHC